MAAMFAVVVAAVAGEAAAVGKGGQGTQIERRDAQQKWSQYSA